MLSPALPLSEALCSMDPSTMPALAGSLHRAAAADLAVIAFVLLPPRAVTGGGCCSRAGTQYLLRSPTLSLLSSSKLRYSGQESCQLALQASRHSWRQKPEPGPKAFV